MTRLRDLDLRRHLTDPALKAAFVTPMFDIVAPRYDDFTRLFSFGMDRGWKKAMMARALAAVPEPRVAVDLASGTGDLAHAVASGTRGCRVAGLDASPAMIAFAKARLAASPEPLASRIEFAVGDLGSIPRGDASVDLITAGYAYRNGPPLEDALRESARVLCPGGVIAVLDFYRPAHPLWRELFLGYLRAAGNAVGWWWHREPVVYGYIAESIRAFVTANEFSNALRQAGFDLIEEVDRLGGGIAIHIARRREK